MVWDTIISLVAVAVVVLIVWKMPDDEEVWAEDEGKAGDKPAEAAPAAPAAAAPAAAAPAAANAAAWAAEDAQSGVPPTGDVPPAGDVPPEGGPAPTDPTALAAGRRDPFRPFTLDLQRADTPEDVPLSPLQRYEIAQLKLDLNAARQAIICEGARSGRLEAELARVMKANASKWIHEEFPKHRAFAWQHGYAAFSVSMSRKDAVQRYIANQEEHHRKLSWREEIELLYKKHKIPFDPKFLD